VRGEKKEGGEKTGYLLTADTSPQRSGGEKKRGGAVVASFVPYAKQRAEWVQGERRKKELIAFQSGAGRKRRGKQLRFSGRAGKEGGRGGIRKAPSLPS